MSDLSRFIRPLAIVVAALLVLGGAGLYMASSNADDEKYHVTGYFTKAIGLFENSDVNILGVPVGKVTEVSPEGTSVRVEMEIDSQYKIEKSPETFAQIVPISVISDRYVQLAPVYEGGDQLQDGAEIPVENTYIPAELDDVFKQLKKLLDAIEPGKEGEPGALGDLIVQLDKTLDDREQDLKGTLITGSQLTSTLSDAQEDISGLLVNLDDLFGQLATRANSFGTLNRNFALVMTALAQSREDLEGTLVNLGSLSGEVNRLVKKNGDRLGRDLGLAARIVGTVLENRASVEESLAWLPVVGKGFTAAYNPESRDIDVRDNANAKLECELLDPLPAGPVKDALKELCREETGEPGGGNRPKAPVRMTPEDLVLGKLDCDEGVRKVKRQLRRVESVGLPADLESEIIDPLRKQLRKLKRECRELGEAIEDEDPGLLDRLKETGSIPDLDSNVDTDGLTGSAADTPVPAAGEPSAWDDFTSWLGGFLSYVGVRS